MKIEVNVNDYVWVQLTEAGKAALRRQHDSLNMQARGLLGEYKPPEEDADGWSKWQLWSLIQDIGPSTSMGSPVPFATTILVDVRVRETPE